MKSGIVCLLLFSVVVSIRGTKVPSVIYDLNEKFLDVKDQGFWLVKLYAPWCGHCKRLAPVWEHLGHALADQNSKIKVGKVDCTRFTSVAHKLKISGYPTIIFFRNGVQIQYEGERSKEALLDFALKSAGPVVKDINTETEFKKVKSQNKVFFVYVGGLNDNLWKEFDEVSNTLFTQTSFFRTDKVDVLPSEVTLEGRPAILVFKHGSYLQYTSKDLKLNEWVKKERWTNFPLVSSSNIHDLSEDTNKKLVLAVVDPVEHLDPGSVNGQFLRKIETAANKVKKDARLSKEYQFGYLEGGDIANSIVMERLTFPNFFVFNLSSYEFYLSDDSTSEFTVESVIAFLETISSGHTQPLGGRSWPTRIKRMVFELISNVGDMFYHQPILTTCLFGVPIAFFSIITYSLCSSDFSVDRDEIYPDEDEEDEDNVYYRESTENTDVSDNEVNHAKAE